MQIHKAWLTVGDKATSVALNHKTYIDWQKRTLVITFPPQAVEPEAIALGRDFDVKENIKTFVNLEAMASNSPAPLFDSSGISGYEISVNPDILRQSIAWYELPSKNSTEIPAVTLELVEVIKQDVPSQVKILPNGEVMVSKDLIGKLVKIRMPVVFDRQIILLANPIESFTAHLIAYDGHYKYIQVKCKPEVDEYRAKGQKIRTVHGSFIEEPNVTRFSH